jgi:hypothetical protein
MRRIDIPRRTAQQKRGQSNMFAEAVCLGMERGGGSGRQGAGRPQRDVGQDGSPAGSVCLMRRLQLGQLAASWGTASQPRKGDVTGCQFGALGALPGGAWRLPPSHRVVGAPEPLPVAPGSAWNMRPHDSPSHPVPPRHAQGAWKKSSPPPLRPRAPRNNPLGPPCVCGGRFSGRPHAPLVSLAARSFIRIQT